MYLLLHFIITKIYKVLVCVSLLETHLRHSLITVISPHSQERKSYVLYPPHSVTVSALACGHDLRYVKIVQSTTIRQYMEIMQYHITSATIQMVLVRPAFAWWQHQAFLSGDQPKRRSMRCCHCCHQLFLQPERPFFQLVKPAWTDQVPSACTLWIGTKHLRVS